MVSAKIDHWRQAIEARFPERHIYIRAASGVRGLVLSTKQQLALVGALCGVALWVVGATVGMTVATVSAHASEQLVQQTRAAYGKMIAAHDAKLLDAVDALAQTKSERLKTTLKMAGVDPATVAPPVGGGEGGPLIPLSDPRAVAALRGINQRFAGPIQKAAKDVLALQALTTASKALPLAKPTASSDQSSGYGARIDPFTGHAAFHPGLDFPAPAMTPVYATAPGVIAFTGERSGYGNTIEIDHGHGFKTRFAHLAAISVHVGDKVSNQQRIGAIGSTGRSTGPHLHYEVWLNGQSRDPELFLKAGDYVQQGG